MKQQDRRILVVDDESIIVEFLGRLLANGQPDRYTIEKACSGRDAVRKAREFAPQLVILDINIPGMNGFEICRTICSDPKCDGVSVLAMTADASADRVREIKEAGAVECLSKPFSLPYFLSIVERYTANFDQKVGASG